MKIAVYGAGSTGCFLGALLQIAGHEVSLICRERIQRQIEDARGITVKDYLGLSQTIMPHALTTQLRGDERFEAVLVTLKCHQLESAKQDFIALAHQGATLYFMQNGLDSLAPIEDDLPANQRLTGIIPFNVLSEQHATFFRGTDGTLVLETGPCSERLVQALSQFNFKAEANANMKSVAYGKLLLNINNALNAIADVPIKTELENRSLRKVLAQAMEEWLRVCEHEGVLPYQYTAVKPQWVPKILRLPNFLFSRLAKAMLDIDPKARSSMWEDIRAGRMTEIVFLNGAISKRGQSLGIPTPTNDMIVDAIRHLEAGRTDEAQGLLRAFSDSH